MRFHFGAIPENTDFDPEAEGWADIREPGPCLIQFLAIPLVFIILILLGSLFYLVWPPGSVTASTTLIVVFGLALFPVHELLHAIYFPEGLRSPNTLIGFWPARLVFYAHYEGEMSRNRFLAMFFIPFFGLSLVPVAIIALFQWPSLELALLSLVNGGAASADLIGILLIGLQIPRSAIVRNRGWRTYWKLEETNHEVV
jgi:hypothetical protein